MIKDATGINSPKMHSSGRCRNRTYLCGTTNYPVSWKQVYGRERKFAEIRDYLSPWYRVCINAMFLSKGSYRYGNSKNAFLLSVQKPHLPVWDGKLPRLTPWCKIRTYLYGPPNYHGSWRGSIGPRMEICVKSGLPIAMVPCLH